MIKVNLLPQRKARRASAAADPSAKQALVGVAALGAAAAAVFFGVDMPRRERLESLKNANAQLQSEINNKNKQLVGFAEMKKAQEEMVKRQEGIKRLMGTKVVPAHLMHELGNILSREGPTMTEEMTAKVGNGPMGSTLKQFSADWDPTRVWISSFVDTNGAFKLEGGAAADSDVTQLSKRLAASVHFPDASPAGVERVIDKATQLSYYRFTITGRLAY